MSEYQYYEFLAVDRPLSQQQMKELRALSTRATITPTRFTNEYHWGDFKGDPVVLVEQYFDLHLYFANWGSRDLAIRLPTRLLDLEAASRYCATEAASSRVVGDHLILWFHAEEENGGWDEEGDGWLGSIGPLRAELAAGDLRGLYLGWLLALRQGELDDDEPEPPPPPGLNSLSAALTAFAEFLSIDTDLIEAAAERSPSLAEAQPSRSEIEGWVGRLPAAEKDNLLIRLIESGDPHLRTELLRRFQESAAARSSNANSDAPRTAGQLLAAAEERAEARHRAEAERKERERERRAREAAVARRQYLDSLVGREPALWRQVDELIATKRPADYDRAVGLITDLRDLAKRAEASEEFDARLTYLRVEHAKKPSFLSRLDRAGLRPTASGGPRLLI